MNQETLSRLDGERRAQQSLLHLLCAVSIWRTAMTRILPLCGAAAWWVTLLCLLPMAHVYGFVCGLLWGLSLIVPGLSSSTILIFIGLFEPLTAGIGSLDLKVMVPFLLGIGTTALLFARLVTMLFQKHYAIFSRVILGFVIASSLKILPASYESPAALLIGLLCFAGGFVVAMVMDGASEKEKH